MQWISVIEITMVLTTEVALHQGRACRLLYTVNGCKDSLFGLVLLPRYGVNVGGLVIGKYTSGSENVNSIRSWMTRNRGECLEIREKETSQRCFCLDR
jgi:hypothetical protein